MSRKVIFGGSLAMLVLALLGPVGGAVAYVGENPYIVEMRAPKQADCNDSVTIRVTIRSSDTGDPGVGQTVRWDVKNKLSPQDRVSPAHTVTDDEGKTSATLTFGEVNGKRTVRVTIASWPTTIRVTCTGAVAAATAAPTAAPTPTSPVVSPVPTDSAAPSAAPTALPSAPPPLGTPTAAPTIPATPQVTIQPTSAPTPAPTPDIGQSGGSSPTAALLPIGLVAVVLLALGGLLLFARRR